MLNKFQIYPRYVSKRVPLEIGNLWFPPSIEWYVLLPPLLLFSKVEAEDSEWEGSPCSTLAKFTSTHFSAFSLVTVTPWCIVMWWSLQMLTSVFIPSLCLCGSYPLCWSLPSSHLRQTLPTVWGVAMVSVKVPWEYLLLWRWCFQENRKFTLLGPQTVP